MCGLENRSLDDAELDCLEIAVILLLVKGTRVDRVFRALFDIKLQKGREVSAKIVMFG